MLEQDQVNIIESLATFGQASVIITGVATTAIYLKSNGYSDALMKCLVLAERISYFKYCNVKYPKFLKMFFDFIDLGQLGMPNVVKIIMREGDDSTPKQSDDQRLRRLASTADNQVTMNSHHNLSYSSVFLETYGGIFFSMLMTLLIYAVLKLVSFCLRNSGTKYAKIKNVIASVVKTLEKSVIATLLVSRYFHLCVGVILNFQYMSLSSSYHKASFSIALIYSILLLILALALLFICFANKKHFDRFPFMTSLFEKVDILYLDFEDPLSNSLARSLPLMTLLLNFATASTIVTLFRWPLLQIMLMTGYDILTVFLHLQSVQFKSKYTRFSLLITEIGLSLISICLLIIYTIQDAQSIYMLKKRIILGWTVIGIGGCILLLQMLNKIVESIVKAKQKAKLKKEEKMRLKEKESRVGVNDDAQNAEPNIRANSTKENSSKPSTGRAIKVRTSSEISSDISRKDKSRMVLGIQTTHKNMQLNESQHHQPENNIETSFQGHFVSNAISEMHYKNIATRVSEVIWPPGTIQNQLYAETNLKVVAEEL